MADYILIGVGGTGAKVLESFVHLAAAGMMTNMMSRNKGEVTVHLRMVDMDTSGGNFQRLEETLMHYKAAYEKIAAYKMLDKNKQKQLDHGKLWSPINIEYDQSTFIWEAGIEDENMKISKQFHPIKKGPKRTLLDTLYSEKDQIMPLNNGCRGVPRIGSLIWAEVFDNDIGNTKGFWKSLLNVSGMDANIKNSGNVRIMLVGSIFGGTGASGVPTLAKKLYDWKLSDLAPDHNNAIGITLMLPYFSFPTERAADNGMQANPDEFILNSKMALRYYQDENFLTALKSVYLIGDAIKSMKINTTTEMPFRIGGKEQTNPALPAELVAAISAMDFFISGDTKGKKKAEGEQKVIVADSLCENKGEQLKWSDFPYTTEFTTALRRLARFALLWKGYYDYRATSSGLAVLDRWEKSKSDDAKKVNTETWGKETTGLYYYCKYVVSWLEQLSYNGMDQMLQLAGKEESLKKSNEVDLLGMEAKDITLKVHESKLENKNDLILSLTHTLMREISRS